MPKRLTVSGRELVRALEKAGFAIRRYRGSHAVLKSSVTGATVSVPIHGNADIPVGTLHSILRDAGLTRDDLADLL